MTFSKSIHAPEQGWRSIVPDLIGCALALAMAWTFDWHTGDLIWSMWLASLVIGYSLILWNLFGPRSIFLEQLALNRTGELRQPDQSTAVTIGALLFGRLFLLAFFTIHFGGFHWGHSIFVNGFYPIGASDGEFGSPTLTDYWTVVKTYGWFLPLAFLAQRDLFGLSRATTVGMQQSRAPNASSGSRQATGRARAGAMDMGVAYKGVVKLHLLIFFLVAADAIDLPEFLTYTVVYLVFFFPWKQVFGKQAAGAPSRGG